MKQILKLLKLSNVKFWENFLDNEVVESHVVSYGQENGRKFCNIQIWTK